MIAVPIAVPFNTPFVITGVVKILFVRVSTVSCNTTVPVAFGKVIVLSAVGSVTVSVVSWSSAVAPSNTIDVLIFKAVAVTELLNVAAPASDTSKLNRSIVDPPSLPCNFKSLFDIADLINTPLESFLILANSVPLSK